MIKSWMVIGAVTVLVAFGSSLLRPKDIKWFARLRRPRWLTFEALIPVIWMIVFACGAWSAYIVWESAPGGTLSASLAGESDPGSSRTWFLMGFYLLVEAVIVAYSPAMLWTQRLKVGTVTGGVGFVLGLILALMVWQISAWAALLLLPYLIWSPIGTYTTWEMSKLNPESA